MAFINHGALEDHTFIRPAGQAQSMRCNLCGAECSVERDRSPIRAWYTGGTGMHEPHDLFTCPNAEAEWHEQAFHLTQEMAGTASRRVRAMLRADLADILAANGIKFTPDLSGLADDDADMNDGGSSQ